MTAAPLRLRWPRAGRRVCVPWWAAAIVACWLALVGAWELLRPEGATLCRFKALTGSPCPTCGTTRAVLAFGGGDPLAAWLANPLMVTAAALAGSWLALRLTTGRTVRVEASDAVRRGAWLAAAALLAGNWVYLIWRGM